MTSAAAIFALVTPDHAVAIVLLAAMILASGLESIFALCIGCELFSVLMRFGVVPASICVECANVKLRSTLG